MADAVAILRPEEPITSCVMTIEGRLTGRLILAFDDASGWALSELLLDLPPDPAQPGVKSSAIRGARNDEHCRLRIPQFVVAAATAIGRNTRANAVAATILQGLRFRRTASPILGPGNVFGHYFSNGNSIPLGWHAGQLEFALRSGRREHSHAAKDADVSAQRRSQVPSPGRCWKLP